MGKTIKLANDTYLVNDLYSTTEKKVGKWINGKPIYRKVHQQSISAGYNYIYLTNIGISNLDTFTKIDGNVVQPSNNITLLCYKVSDTDFTLTYFSRASWAIVIRCGENYGFGTLRLILEYTKSTD